MSSLCESLPLPELARHRKALTAASNTTTGRVEIGLTEQNSDSGDLIDIVMLAVGSRECSLLRLTP
jgi:hypothetical protein